MILTCPACSTKYVVKDGAIPPSGRQVRCASCKHSWHQDPEEGAPPAEEQAAVAEPVAVQPEPEPEPQPEPEPEPEPEPHRAPQPDPKPTYAMTDTPNPLDQIIAEAPSMAPDPPQPPPIADDRQWQAVRPAAAWDEAGAEPAGHGAGHGADDFEPFYDHEPFEQPKRKWPILLLLVLLVALAAVAFWFLAPAELRARAGLASTDGSQLHVVVNTNNYQRLASGNTLFTVSGRIVNSTGSRQPVPPIRAELLDKTKQKVIYSWTISPPAATLDLNKSASFNSAEIDVPEGGEFIRIRLGGPA